MNIDRRTLFGATGATVALAACSPVSSQGEPSLTANDRSKDLFGKSLSNKVPAVSDPKTGKLRPANYNGEFKPAYDYLAFIKFDGGKLIVRDAYFKSTDGVEDPKRVAEQFNSMSKSGRWGASAEGASDSFADFGFGSQTRLYFYLDNGGDVRFDDINLIHMALFKSRDQKKPLPKDNAFVNIAIRNIEGLSVLYVENWYVRENGKLIETPIDGDIADPVPFSMNIHVIMKSGTDAQPFDAPLVIDPDGTNGRNKP